MRRYKSHENSIISITPQVFLIGKLILRRSFPYCEKEGMFPFWQGMALRARSPFIKFIFQKKQKKERENQVIASFEL